VFIDRWWITVLHGSERFVLFWNSYDSPQCNLKKSVADSVPSHPPNTSDRKVIFVPVAYVPKEL
jgi:hypothetical protein